VRVDLDGMLLGIIDEHMACVNGILITNEPIGE